MNVALSYPWTAEQFLDWVGTQEGRYEYDGERIVAMTGGTSDHNRISQNIYAALRSRLRGTRCSYFGPDLGIRTIGEAVRFPDALITCTKFPGTDRLAAEPVVVFEVLSPGSGRRDRIEKAREYAAVTSIRCYVIIEGTAKGLQVLHRDAADTTFAALTLTEAGTLALPEVGISVPVAEFYEDVEFDQSAAIG